MKSRNHAAWLSGLALVAGMASGSTATAETTRQYTMEPDGGAYQLVMREIELPELAANEVLVRVRAVSLNRRDLSQLGAAYGDTNYSGKVPVSDGAGEVVATGSDVTAWSAGDRVAGTFFREWISGPGGNDVFATSRGGNTDGMLSEYVIASDVSLVSIPEHLSFEEAATLPCAALTAWTGLFKHGEIEAGDYVLLEGTGGVSVFGLLLSAAAGAQPIITSSSDAKLEKARELGAIGTVNYRTTPDWEVPVREYTGGAGVDHVLEVGGNATIAKALQSLSETGHLARIGGLTGRDEVAPASELQAQGYNATQIRVGSREDFENMNAFITEHQIRPVIDRVFTFEEAQQAYEYMDSNAFFGKIVISL